MVFCNARRGVKYGKRTVVTILILIDGFLQYTFEETDKFLANSHNPYFNRWFSAIRNAIS